MNKFDQSEAVLVLAGAAGKMIVFSLAGAPLIVSQDATRAVNLLYCPLPSKVALTTMNSPSRKAINITWGIKDNNK